MRRFDSGDDVKIVPVIATRYAGNIGKIKSTKYNARDRTTLDKYLVEFEDGIQAWFWSIQLDDPDVPMSGNGARETRQPDKFPFRRP